MPESGAQSESSSPADAPRVQLLWSRHAHIFPIRDAVHHLKPLAIRIAGSHHASPSVELLISDGTDDWEDGAGVQMFVTPADARLLASELVGAAAAAESVTASDPREQHDAEPMHIMTELLMPLDPTALGVEGITPLEALTLGPVPDGQEIPHPSIGRITLGDS